MASARTSLTSQRPLGKTKYLKRTMTWNQAQETKEGEQDDSKPKQFAI